MNRLYVVMSVATILLTGCGSSNGFTPSEIAGFRKKALSDVQSFEAMSPEQKARAKATGSIRQLLATLRLANDPQLSSRFMQDLKAVGPVARQTPTQEEVMKRKVMGGM